MWRTAASLELLPVGTKTELGDALVRRVKAGISAKASSGACRVWARASCSTGRSTRSCRRPSPAVGWKRCCRSIPGVGDALAAIARRTEDPTRDLARRRPWRRCGANSKACRMPSAIWRYSRVRRSATSATLGRIFGEELPSGLVLAGSPSDTLRASGARDQNADSN